MLFRRDYAGEGASTEPVVVEADSPIVSGAGVTSEALGIETIGGAFTPLVPAGSAVPCGATETFTTAVDRQTEIPIRLYRGSGKKVEENYFLGQFGIGGIPPAPCGKSQIEITFAVSAAREIRLSARDNTSGELLSVRRIAKR